MPTPLSFNANWYLKQNPDVAAAIEAGAPFNAFEHFQLYGRTEGRSASPLFDPQEYLSNNPDVAEAVAQGLITAWDHFELFGGDEGRSPTPLFNEAFYLQQNPDVAAAIEQGIIASAAQHFALFGQSEPRAINPSINLAQYLNVNPDIGEAVANGLINAFSHLLEYGVNEGRDLGNGVNLKDFVNDPDFTNAIASGNFQEALGRVDEVAPFLSTFVKAEGWAPAANTPIPVTFVPVEGQKLVVPEGVMVPEGTTLPDTFEPVTPVVPPVEPPVTPPVDTFTVKEVAGEVTFTNASGNTVTITSLGDPTGTYADNAGYRLLTVVDGANKTATLNISVDSAFALAAGQALTVTDQLISKWDVKGPGDVVITNSATVGSYDLTTLLNTGTLTLPVLAAGHTLILTSAQVSGKAITGAGAVQVASLNATTDLSGIATLSLSAKVINDMTFTGHFGKALVTVETGKVLTLGDSAIVGAATIKADGELQGNASVLKGLSAIIGKVTVLDTGSVTAAALISIGNATSDLVTATTATAIVGSVMEITNVIITSKGDTGHKTNTAPAIAITISNAADATLTATELSAIGAATTGQVTVTNAVAISGTAAELKVALLDPDTKVIAPTAVVTVTGAISLADLVLLDGTTTATKDIISTAISDTAAALNANVDDYLTENMAVTITDAAGTAVTASVLSSIKAMTTGTVTVSNALAISGTSAELKAALVDADTKVIAPTAVVTVTDLDGTEITAQALNAIGALSNTVTVTNAVSISGNTAELKTALAGKFAKVSAPDAVVTVTDAIRLTDDLWALSRATTKEIVYSTVTDRWVNLQADEGRYIGGDVAVIITDVAGTAITAQTLSTIKALTTGEVTISNALALSGTAAQLKAALVTENTKVIAPTTVVTVTDAISLDALAALDGATTATKDIIVTALVDSSFNLFQDYGGYVSGDKTITITDAADSILSASHLAVIGGRTTGTVTVTHHVNLQGTLENITAALITPDTKVNVSSVNLEMEYHANATTGGSLGAAGEQDHLKVYYVQGEGPTNLTGLSGFETVTIFTEGDGSSAGNLVSIANSLGTKVIVTGGDSNVQLGSGGQTFTGGAGNDHVLLGVGADKVVLSQTTGVDTIQNFNDNNDRIEISKAAFAAVGEVGPLGIGMFRGVLNFENLGGTLEDTTESAALIYVADTGNLTGNLYYNADGNTAGGLVLIATFQSAGIVPLQEGMFTVIA